MAKDLAVILNNGSINSAVTTALASQKYRPLLLYADIAQRPGSRTRAAYEQQVQHFKPYREHTMAMPYLEAITPSASQPVISDPRMPTALFPMLQELLPLLASAARYAAHYQAAAIYLGLRIGGHGDELARATEYLQIWSELLQLPCGLADLEINAPLLELEPWQVVDVGFQASAPFERTWSCMEEGGEPCWACRGCRARENAFQQSGKADPMRVVRKL